MSLLARNTADFNLQDANAETLALVCPNTTASGAQQRCALPTPFVITVGNSTLNYTATNGAATSTVSCEYTPESPDADRVAADCSGTVDGGAMPGSVLFAIDTVGSEVNITAGLEKLVTATGSESRQTATMASMTGTPSTSAASVHTGTSTAAAAGSTMVSGLGGFVAGVAIVVAAL